MRNKNRLRILSVMAAAFICAVWIFARCSSPTTGGVDQNDASSNTLTLDALELSYKTPGKQATLPDLIFNFDKNVMSYQVDELEPHEIVIVKAVAEGTISITITVDGTAFDNPAEVLVPKAGAEGKTVKITLGKNGITSAYTITLNPAQSNHDDDASLQSLFIGYTGTSASIMISTLNGSSGTAQVDDESKSQAVVIAKASSKFSKISFLYDGAALSKNGGTDNSPQTNITLPQRQDSSKLEVVVTAANGSGKTYTVTVNGFQPSLTRWHGTVNSDDPDYKITKVTVKSAAGWSYDATPVLQQDLGTGMYVWNINTSLYYEPAFIIVNMEKVLPPVAPDTEPVIEHAQSKAYTLEGLGRGGVKASDTVTNPIAIPIKSADIGILIMKAQQFKDLLDDSANRNKNFALGQSIDLTEATGGGAWVGPGGYAGQLYGNGHTIKNLILKRTGHKVGLFSTLGDGAEIFDMKIEISNENPGEDIMGDAYVGGIVGNPTNVSFKIKNVTVSGTLHFKGLGSAGVGMIGGLIGEIGNSTSRTVDIEKCTSNFNIILDDMAGLSNNTCTFGGFIAKSTGMVNITDSYSAGTIQVRNNAHTRLSAGGLIGDISSGKVVINRSYVSGDVIVENNTDAAGWTRLDRDLFAGGFVGQIKGVSTLEIHNSAALNGKVLSLAANVPARAYYGRLYGGFIYVVNESAANTVKIENTLARLAMITGKIETGEVDADPVGDKDGEQQYQITTALGSGAATLKGLGLDDAEFKKKETWTTNLGWDIETWDFKKIAEDGKPRLK